MIPGIRYATIDDPERRRTFKILYPLPAPENAWGVFLPLRETSWGREIPVVSGEALSHALHGYPKPLLGMLKTPPLARAVRLPLTDKLCYEHQCHTCAMAKPHCHPGSGQMPECYVAPTEDRDLRDIGVVIAKAWEEGRYVFVVEGPEFLIT